MDCEVNITFYKITLLCTHVVDGYVQYTACSNIYYIVTGTGWHHVNSLNSVKQKIIIETGQHPSGFFVSLIRKERAFISQN